MVVGVSGKITSGKDTAAAMLQEYFAEKNIELSK